MNVVCFLLGVYLPESRYRIPLINDVFLNLDFMSIFANYGDLFLFSLEDINDPQDGEDHNEQEDERSQDPSQDRNYPYEDTRQREDEQHHSLFGVVLCELIFFCRQKGDKKKYSDITQDRQRIDTVGFFFNDLFLFDHDRFFDNIVFFIHIILNLSFNDQLLNNYRTYETDVQSYCQPLSYFRHSKK